MIKCFTDYINSINEGLIKTYKGDVVLRNILKKLNQFSLNVSGEFVDNKIKLTINKFNLIQLNQIDNIFNQIYVSVVNNGGWFPSIMELDKLTGIYKYGKFDLPKIINIHDELESITIHFESKFDTIVDDIPDKLYHLTIKEYSKKINRYGLIPRSKSKLSSHIDRIYVCDNYQDCKDLIPSMMFHYTGERDENIYKLGKKLFNKNIEPIIYEIDNSTQFISKLYVDVNYDKKGYYILDNIPSDKILITASPL